jgi:hypothetical protein
MADGLGPVPEDNLPGHHPEVEQDKPTGPPPRLHPEPGIERFAFRFDPVMLPFALGAGVVPRATGVEVGDGVVSMRFGVWRMRFPLDQVAGVDETGDYWLPKVAGPPRVSFADRGVTFATNREAGLCVRLRAPQRGPYPLLRHPSVTLTVETPDALAAALTR